MKNFLLFLTCFCASASLQVQGQSPFNNATGFSISKTIPSPDVASLGNFGLVPANPFNGQANISIPLYTIAYKDLEVPMAIAYSTGGHRVDEHPGWLGLGWSLQAGGMIYRKVNGLYDEHPKISTWNNEICYYYNCGRLSANINNTDTITAYSLNNLPVDEIYKYNFDALPDEFIFNFNGYSGTFFITRPSPAGAVEIKVKPNGPYKLKAEITEIKENIVFDDWMHSQTGNFVTRTTGRSIYSIKITDDRGIQYIFGGNPKSIEFSGNGLLNEPYYTIPNAWHLTEIISPGGYSIKFTYKRAGRVFSQVKQRNATFYDLSYNFAANTLILYSSAGGSYSYSGEMESINISIQNPVYLESIVTPLQTVLFTSSTTNELDYPFDAIKLRELTDPNNRYGADKRTWQKLDEINLVGHKRISFNYRHQVDKRLRLESIHFKTPELEIKQSYAFQYNQMNLPNYNSKMADHWGYYNGRSYAYDNNYLTTREPDAQYLQAEMLESITYPTGGYLKLTYEPHYYSKIAKQFPFEVENKTNNIMAGGLRVKKTEAAPSTQDVPQTKEYYYITNYLNNGTASSGILSGIPQYHNTGSRRNSYRSGNFWQGSWGSSTLYYGQIIDNNNLPLSTTNGNHVTYSEVTEKAGEGYTVYQYTNHDNGYLDRDPYVTYTNYDSKWHEEKFVSLEPFRGQLRNVRHFNNNKQLVKELAYEYNEDMSTSYYTIPYFCRNFVTLIQGYPMSRVSTGVYFIKPVLLKKQIETDYVPGSTGTISVTKTYRFFTDAYPSGNPADDNYKETSLTVTGSTKELKATYAYPFDMVAAGRDPNGIYQGMVDRNMLSPVVEQISFKDGTQTELSRTNFHSPNTSQYLPQTEEKQIANNTIETRVRYLAYDNKGNLLTLAKEKDVKNTWIWDYQQAFRVAEVTGADETMVAYTSFESNGNGNWVVAGSQRQPGGFTGRVCYQLSNGNISKSGLSASTTYIVSYWTQNSSAFTVSGTIGSPVLIQVAGAWKCFEHQVSGVTQVTVAGTGLIDELRQYPRGAQMTTYTYDPLVGITSRSDIRNEPVYYIYDDFSRLYQIRDINNNILKQYKYEYPSSQPQ